MKGGCLGRLSLVLALGLTACASAPVVDTYRVRFTSEPPDATVKVAGQSCVTPCVLRLPKGDHPAQVFLTPQEAQAVMISSSHGKPSFTQNMQSAMGNTLQTTGTVLDTLGEATIQVFGTTRHGSYSGETAVVLVALGTIGITGKLTGQMLIKVGDGMMREAADPDPASVHIVFKSGRWSGAVEQSPQ